MCSELIDLNLRPVKSAIGDTIADSLSVPRRGLLPVYGEGSIGSIPRRKNLLFADRRIDQPQNRFVFLYWQAIHRFGVDIVFGEHGRDRL